MPNPPLTNVAYDIIIHDMVEVLLDRSRSYSVRIDPYSPPAPDADAVEPREPASCYAFWNDGICQIAMGTWAVLAGDKPPYGLIELLRSNEAYLWEQWAFHRR